MGNHKTMVVLGVENEQELKEWMHKLVETGISAEAFIEPDRNNEVTAVATLPTTDKKLFKKLRLL